MMKTILSALRQFLQDACPLPVQTAHSCQKSIPNRMTEPFLVLDMPSLYTESPLFYGNTSLLRYPFTAEVQVLLAAPICCDAEELQALLSKYVLPPVLQAGFTVTEIRTHAPTDRHKPFPQMHTITVTVRVNGVYTTERTETDGEHSA